MERDIPISFTKSFEEVEFQVCEPVGSRALSYLSYLHKMQALCTHFSGSSTTISSTLVGHSCLYGMRGPHMSLIESRDWRKVGGPSMSTVLGMT